MNDSPLQARLYMGDEWLVLKHYHADQLEAKLRHILERSRAWTRADIVDIKTHQRVFQARKVTRWGIPLILEQRFTGD